MKSLFISEIDNNVKYLQIVTMQLYCQFNHNSNTILIQVTGVL